MIARELETIIEREISKFGISNQPWGHVSQRFESLRSYGLLPKGKVRNSKHLTSNEIVAGILSIISPNIGFSGHTALILKGLKPVGGDKASFLGSKTLYSALEALIENKDSCLDKLLKVSISDSEIYTNSHCRASIHYILDGQEYISYYVCGTSVSLTKEGAEEDYDPSKISSSVINEITFYPSFFKTIYKTLRHEASMPPVEYPEEPETDIEIEKQRRAEYLGLKPSSRFLNLGVDCQVTWPKHETLVEFDGYKLVLLPKTKEKTTSIHIDLTTNKLNHEEARTVVNRFLDGTGTMHLEDGSVQIAFEAKKYKSKYQVGSDICQKLAGAMGVNNIKHGFLITTSYFSDRAWESKENIEKNLGLFIEFIDQERIADLMLEKGDELHGFGLLQTEDYGWFYINKKILRKAVK